MAIIASAAKGGCFGFIRIERRVLRMGGLFNAPIGKSSVISCAQYSSVFASPRPGARLVRENGGILVGKQPCY
jgi:hypothetical protein